MRLINRSRGTTIADHVEVATSIWARGKGLIGRKSLPEGYLADAVNGFFLNEGSHCYVVAVELQRFAAAHPGHRIDAEERGVGMWP